MLVSQAMLKQNPINAQLSEANGIQQMKNEEQYLKLQLIMEYQLYWAALTLQGAHTPRPCPRPLTGWPALPVFGQILLKNVYKYDQFVFGLQTDPTTSAT